MIKILFTAATSWELRVLKQEIKKLTLKNIRVDFLLIWIWNYSTIYNLSSTIDKQKYNFIVNIWVCGYSEICQKFIQIGRIKNLSNNKELIVPSFIKMWNLESIASSEKIIYLSDEIWEENFVDMESYGVEFVSSQYEIPRIILKVPVDKIWEETKKFDFEKAKKLLWENIDYKLLLDKISEYIEKNKTYKTDNVFLKKYHNHYKMSFAEKAIFEKLFNKYSVLIEDEWWENFEDFFEKNKELNKKEFFRKLEQV